MELAPSPKPPSAFCRLLRKGRTLAMDGWALARPARALSACAETWTRLGLAAALPQPPSRFCHDSKRSTAGRITPSSALARRRACMASAVSSGLLRRRSPRPHPPSPLRAASRSEEHTSELQSPCNLVCRLLL